MNTDGARMMPTMAEVAGRSVGSSGPQQQREDAEQHQRRQQEAEAMKNTMLTSLLEQKARARLETIRLAKPEKGAQLETMLLNMARTGQLKQRLSEDELVGLLERVSEGMQARSSGKVKFDRRRAALDSDSD